MSFKIQDTTIIDDNRNIVNANQISAVSFTGDGSNLTGIISGIGVKYDGINIDTGITSINFIGTGIQAVTTNNLGLATVAVDLQSNLDGGSPNTNYGGIEAINGGTV